MHRVILLLLLCLCLPGKGQSVYTTPLMYDTSAYEKLRFIDSSFHPHVAIKNESNQPLTMRFLVGWKGHEHILDSDSAWFSWVNRDTFQNLAAFLKTPLAGTNRHSIQVVDDTFEKKKFRIVDFFLGFSGRKCNDYANAAYYFFTLNKMGVRRAGTVRHAFVTLRPGDSPLWLAWDFDWSTPILKYQVPFENVLSNRDALLKMPLYKDCLSPFSAVCGNYAQTRQMFWKEYIGNYHGPVFTFRPSVPQKLFSTSNRLILPPGASITYKANCRGLVLNSDFNDIRNFETTLNDTMSFLEWNETADSIIQKIILALTEKFTRNLSATEGEKIRNALKTQEGRFQNGFGQYLFNSLQALNYQLLEIKIPPHKDTLYAGKDYSFYFWVERMRMHGNALVGDKFINSDSAVTLLGICDSMERNPKLYTYKVQNETIQNMTTGWLAPTSDTTIIYGHFNLNMFPFLTGVNYEVISGAAPVVTSSYKSFKREPASVQIPVKKPAKNNR